MDFLKIKNLLIIGLIALVLNLAWEFSHYALYIDLSGIAKYPHLILASLVDMLIVFIILIFVSLKNKDFGWVERPTKIDYFSVIVLGFLIAVLIEAVNLNLGRWAYQESMPVIFGLGLSPLVQLSLTGSISLFILNRLKK